MPAAWHLAINNLAARWGRSLLLVAAVALASALVVAAASAIATIERSLRLNLGQIAGLADLQIQAKVGGQTFDQKILGVVAAWPQVADVSPQLDQSARLLNPANQKASGLMLVGVEEETYPQLHPRKMLSGRGPAASGEILVDQLVQERLQAQLGDELSVETAQGKAKVTLVGVMERPPLAVLQMRLAQVSLEQAIALSGAPGRFSEISVRLAGGVDPDRFAAAHKEQLPAGIVMRTAASASINLNNGLRVASLLLHIMTTLVFLSAAFIILTTQTTAVTERQRELAVLRCVGASRGQIGWAQLLVGLTLSCLGALVGAPLGLLMARQLYLRHAEVLTAGFAIPVAGVAQACIAAVLAGLGGALYPAIRAAGVSPMRAMTVRSRPISTGALVAWTCAGLALALVQPLAMSLPIDIEKLVWFYAYIALALTFIGYFLLSVPVLLLLTAVLGPILEFILALPRPMLRQSARATPMRHGLTGGALMVSLAMLVAIWTSGKSITHGWFDRLEMPDAFVHSYFSLTQQQYEALQAAPAITNACPVTAFQVWAKGPRFGIAAASPPALFVSTDIDAFLKMTSLKWIQGDPETAVRRLALGQAVLVSNEYLVAHQVGLGSKLVLPTEVGDVEFEVVGVVGSTGLDVAVHHFGIHREYDAVAMNAIFGSRQDAIRYWQNDAINLVLLSLDPEVTDRQAMVQIRAAIPGLGQMPGLNAGTSRGIRRQVHRASNALMSVASSVALVCLVIACVGVGNLLWANILARKFEMGILRAIGGSRLLLVRLILGETLLIAATGCICGSLLGIQLSAISSSFHQRLLGLEYPLELQWKVMALGWAIVAGSALLATLPALLGLVRASPRALLAPGRAG